MSEPPWDAVSMLLQPPHFELQPRSTVQSKTCMEAPALKCPPAHFAGGRDRDLAAVRFPRRGQLGAAEFSRHQDEGGRREGSSSLALSAGFGMVWR